MTPKFSAGLFWDALDGLTRAEREPARSIILCALTSGNTSSIYLTTGPRL
jgi:hypothetical protein